MMSATVWTLVGPCNQKLAAFHSAHTCLAQFPQRRVNRTSTTSPVCPRRFRHQRLFDALPPPPSWRGLPAVPLASFLAFGRLPTFTDLLTRFYSDTELREKSVFYISHRNWHLHAWFEEHLEGRTSMVDAPPLRRNQRIAQLFETPLLMLKYRWICTVLLRLVDTERLKPEAAPSPHPDRPGRAPPLSSHGGL